MLHLAVDRNVVQDRQLKPLIDVPLVVPYQCGGIPQRISNPGRCQTSAPEP
jgi:hypothetical protein